MTLQFLDSVYKNIFNMELAYFVYFSKFLGGTILTVMLMKRLFKSFSKHGKVFSTEEDGFSPSELLRGLGLIFLVGISTEILSLFDSILVNIETIAFNAVQSTQDLIDTGELPLDLPPHNEDTNTRILRYVMKIAEYLNPMNWITGSMALILQGLFYLIDIFIYPFFLAKRYFIMGIIKLFVPIMIALSIFDKTRDYIYNIFKLYARYFIAIVPMMFVTVMCNLIHSSILEMISHNVWGQATMMVQGGTIRIIAILFVIALKVSLFRESFKLAEKLIP